MVDSLLAIVMIGRFLQMSRILLGSNDVVETDFLIR